MKLKMTYQPEGAEPKVWEFDPRRLLTPEVISIQKMTGMPFGAWVEAIFEQDAAVWHALLYTFLKRDTPSLRADSLAFAMADVDFDVQMDDDEAKAARDRLREQAVLDDDERDLLADLEKRLGADEGEDAEDPKAD